MMCPPGQAVVSCGSRFGRGRSCPAQGQRWVQEQPLQQGRGVQMLVLPFVTRVVCVSKCHQPKADSLQGIGVLILVP